MSDIFKDRESIIEGFQRDCKTICKSLIETLNLNRVSEKVIAKRSTKSKFLDSVNDLIIKVLKSIIYQTDQKQEENSEEGDDRSSNPLYELIPELFHEFILFYFNKHEFFLKYFPDLTFDWIYDKFKSVNDNMNHFKIPLKSIKYMIKQLNNGTCTSNWLEVTLLRDNYNVISSGDIEYTFLLKNLLLLSLRYKNRKIKDIKI